IVQRDGVWELSPRERVNFQDVVEEFNQFVGILSNVSDLVGLLQPIEVATDLFDTASGWPDDTVVTLEILDKETFGGSGVDFIAAIGHGLPAASLVERIADIEPESLQQFQCGYSNLGIDHFDVARYEEADFHIPVERLAVYGFG